MSSKVGELKKLLEEFDDDMVVTVCADHGQSVMGAYDVGVAYVLDLEEYMMEEIAEEDLEDYDEAIKVLCIAG